MSCDSYFETVIHYRLPELLIFGQMLSLVKIVMQLPFIVVLAEVEYEVAEFPWSSYLANYRYLLYSALHTAGKKYLVSQHSCNFSHLKRRERKSKNRPQAEKVFCFKRNLQLLVSLIVINLGYKFLSSPPPPAPTQFYGYASTTLLQSAAGTTCTSTMETPFMLLWLLFSGKKTTVKHGL